MTDNDEAIVQQAALGSDQVEKVRPDQVFAEPATIKLTDGYRAKITPGWNRQWTAVVLNVAGPASGGVFEIEVTLDAETAERLGELIAGAARTARGGRYVLQNVEAEERLGVDSAEAQAADQEVIDAPDRAAFNEY